MLPTPKVGSAMLPTPVTSACLSRFFSSPPPSSISRWCPHMRTSHSPARISVFSSFAGGGSWWAFPARGRRRGGRLRRDDDTGMDIGVGAGLVVPAERADAHHVNCELPPVPGGQPAAEDRRTDIQAQGQGRRFFNETSPYFILAVRSVSSKHALRLFFVCALGNTLATFSVSCNLRGL